VNGKIILLVAEMTISISNNLVCWVGSASDKVDLEVALFNTVITVAIRIAMIIVLLDFISVASS